MTITKSLDPRTWDEYADYVKPMVEPLIERARLVAELKTRLGSLEDRHAEILAELEKAQNDLKPQLVKVSKAIKRLENHNQIADDMRSKIDNLQQDAGVVSQQIYASKKQITKLGGENAESN